MPIQQELVIQPMVTRHYLLTAQGSVIRQPALIPLLITIRGIITRAQGLPHFIQIPREATTPLMAQALSVLIQQEATTQLQDINLYFQAQREIIIRPPEPEPYTPILPGVG